MSLARVHYVKHARQRFQKVAKVDDDGKPVRSPVTSRRTGEPKAGRGGHPMTRRITVANKEKPLPNLKCEKCGTEIKPGDPYRWFSVGFRSTYKHIRDMNSECTPKDSELESSKLSAVYAAVEDAQSQMAQATEPDEIESIVQDVASAVREVAEEYREASVNPNTGSVFNTDAEERADNLESVASELEGWSHSQDSEEPSCSEHDEFTEDCEDCVSERDEWIQSIRDDADDALSNATSI